MAVGVGVFSDRPPRVSGLSGDRDAGLAVRASVQTSLDEWAGSEGNAYLRFKGAVVPARLVDCVYFVGGTLLYPRRIFVTDRTDFPFNVPSGVATELTEPSEAWLRAQDVRVVIDVLDDPARSNNWLDVRRLAPAVGD